MYWVFAKLFLTLEYRRYDKSEDTARFEEELEEDAVGGSFFDERRGGKLYQYISVHKEAAKCSSRRNERNITNDVYSHP